MKTFFEWLNEIGVAGIGNFAKLPALDKVNMATKVTGELTKGVLKTGNEDPAQKVEKETPDIIKKASDLGVPVGYSGPAMLKSKKDREELGEDI
jgi:hypothetical protein